MTFTWDEPTGCSPRGWLMDSATCVGFYLDYGPDHYRTPHAEILNTVYGPRERVWCEPGRECRECQPGNILAVRYPAGPRTAQGSRYVETMSEAREYVKTGQVTQHASAAA